MTRNTWRTIFPPPKAEPKINTFSPNFLPFIVPPINISRLKWSHLCKPRGLQPHSQTVSTTSNKQLARGQLQLVDFIFVPANKNKKVKVTTVQRCEKSGFANTALEGAVFLISAASPRFGKTHFFHLFPGAITFHNKNPHSESITGEKKKKNLGFLLHEHKCVCYSLVSLYQAFKLLTQNLHAVRVIVGFLGFFFFFTLTQILRNFLIKCLSSLAPAKQPTSGCLMYSSHSLSLFPSSHPPPSIDSQLSLLIPYSPSFSCQ